MLADISVDVNDLLKNQDFPYWSTKGISLMLLVKVTLSIVETITALAVEGLLIYYSLFFRNIMREFNEVHLKEFFDQLRDSKVSSAKLDRSLQEKRIRLISLHSAFEQGSNALSPLLAVSMLDSLLTTSFGIYYLDKSRVSKSFDYFGFYNRVLLKLFISQLKILIMCIVSEYPNNEVS